MHTMLSTFISLLVFTCYELYFLIFFFWGEGNTILNLNASFFKK